MSETEIKMGIYRHYRGQLYQVLGIAHDANADTLGREVEYRLGGQRTVKPLGERTVVVYMPLQLDGAHLGPRMAVRTLKDFMSTVQPGLFVKRRFTYLGPELTAEMLASQAAS